MKATQTTRFSNDSFKINEQTVRPVSKNAVRTRPDTVKKKKTPRHRVRKEDLRQQNNIENITKGLRERIKYQNKDEERWNKTNLAEKQNPTNQAQKNYQDVSRNKEENARRIHRERGE